MGSVSDRVIDGAPGFAGHALIFGAAYSLWMVRRYDSSRAGAVALFTCFLCGFVVLTIIGTYFRGPNWHFYWSPADWPAH